MTKDCKKKSIWARLIVIAVLACTASNAQAQLIAGRTNALLWGNLTPNFSLELVTSNRTSVMAGAFYSLDQNPLDCSIKGAEAQVRYWVSGRAMVQSFIGLGIQGIGTMTYLEPNGSFGALGHGISDSDTGHLMESHEGSLYETEILGIEKGSVGNPGIMAGVIYYGPGCLLGEIHANTETGIFGNANEALRSRTLSSAIPVGYCQDIGKGPALLRSNVSGQIRDYEIEIQKIELNPLQKNKSMVIHITDPELLKLTGGIVQGMSGSPIIQNGKLIGAVTHVFVQDSTKGYGIFIETMLEADDSGSQ